MALLITGHPRSGTTLLYNLCNRHPEMAVTIEFNNFGRIDIPFRVYFKHILRQTWKEKNRSFLIQGAEERSRHKVLQSYAFVVRYLCSIALLQRSKVSVKTIEGALHRLFPERKVVGDKFPYYVFQLDQFVQSPSLKSVVVYRNCPNVVNSFLTNVRTVWLNQEWAQKNNSAELIAKRWVMAIEAMERHESQIHTVRYEDILRQPDEILTDLADYLGVDPGGFRTDIIRRDNDQRPKDALRTVDKEVVFEIAGSAMARLGYL